MVRIAFVGREGRTIVESADGEHMAFGEIAGAIAAVLAPDLPDEASENAKLVRAMERLAVLEMHETSLKSLANTGEVPLIADCRLRLPVALPVGEKLRRAFVPLRWVSNYCLEWGIGICDADAQALDYSEQQRFKAEQGRYTLEEAAKEMVVNVSADEKGILGNLIDAAIAGELPVYQPGKKQRYRPQVVLGFYEEAYWDDLNQWLAANEKRICWRFSEPDKVKRLNQENNEAAPHAKKREWHAKAWDIGKQWMVAQEKQTGTMPSVQAAATHVEREFKRLDIRGVRGDYYSAATIKREALTGLSGRPANGKKQRNPPR